MADFAYISVGYDDPRTPMVWPGRRDIRSIYLQLTPAGDAVIAVFYFNPQTQKWSKQ